MLNDDRRARAFAALCVAVLPACAERGGPEAEAPQQADGGRLTDSAVDAARDSGVGDATVDGELSCSALAVVQSRCATCHAEEPNSDAPMALVSAENFEAESVSDDTQTVRELALQRIRDQDAPMPPADAEPLSDDERTLLESWLEGGARFPETDCEQAEEAERRVSP